MFQTYFRRRLRLGLYFDDFVTLVPYSKLWIIKFVPLGAANDYKSFFGNGVTFFLQVLCYLGKWLLCWWWTFSLKRYKLHCLRSLTLFGISVRGLTALEHCTGLDLSVRWGSWPRSRCAFRRGSDALRGPEPGGLTRPVPDLTRRSYLNGARPKCRRLRNSIAPVTVVQL